MRIHFAPFDFTHSRLGGFATILAAWAATMANSNNHRGDPHINNNDGLLPSADPRQPQLNTTVCGCRCRVTGCADGNGGGNEPDTEPDQDFFSGEEGIEYDALHHPVPAPRVNLAIVSFTTSLADSEQSRRGFEYANVNILLQDLFDNDSRHGLQRVNSDDSMANQFGGSGPSSMTSSLFLSRHSETPSTMLLNVGAWTTTAPGYFFTRSPLPLVASVRCHHTEIETSSNGYMYAGDSDSEDVDEEKSGN